MEIRAARPEDTEIIARFNEQLASETEGLVLDPFVIRAGVRALLQDPAKGRYFVAATNGKVVGQIMHTYEWSDWRNAWFWWIQSVYVAPESRAQGVFKALHRHLEMLASSTGSICGLRLYVEDGNQRAQEVYTRLGLKMAGYRVMATPDILGEQ
jgi:GNAT superfamily N-acetyltransferase